MIETELARKFIEQVTQYTEYNINIMDENGVIIASRDPGRVGTYHEVADHIIHGPKDVIVIRDDSTYPGVLPGINMAVILDGRKEGVVGVTGDPDKIRDVAMITRMAMEAMLRYEKQQEQIRLRRNRKEQLLSLLTQGQYADSSEIRGIARQLEYNEELVRVPVLCKIRKPEEGASGDRRRPVPPAEDVLEAMRRGKGHWRQDFSFVADETHLLVFKTVKVNGRKNLTDYREEISEYLEYIRRWLSDKGVHAVFYVGSLQKRFSQYYYSYRHCKWLESHVNTTDNIVFFADYIREYFRTLIPRQELQQVFYIYGKEIDEDLRKQFVELVGALEDANYNLSEAAKRLYIHKNTLVYRYNKMKDYLGVNPLESADDRRFMELLYLYLAK